MHWDIICVSCLWGNSMFLSICYMHTLEMLSYTLHFTRVSSDFVAFSIHDIVVILVPGQYYHSSVLLITCSTMRSMTKGVTTMVFPRYRVKQMWRYSLRNYRSAIQVMLHRSLCLRGECAQGHVFNGTGV